MSLSRALDKTLGRKASPKGGKFYDKSSAWDGSGDPPAGVGWTTNTTGTDVLPDVGNKLSYTQTVYDEAGRVAMTIALDELGNEVPTSYLYDKAGKQTDVINALGHTLNGDAWEIDVSKGQRTKTEYEGTRRKYVYDARAYRNDDQGQPVFDHQGMPYSYDYRTEFTYDDPGRLIKTTHPATTQNPVTYTHVGYDSLGRRAWQSKQTTIDTATGLGPEEKREFEHDAAGRLTAVVLPAVALDPHNNPSVKTRPRYEYVYDNYGNLIEIWDNIEQDRPIRV